MYCRQCAASPSMATRCLCGTEIFHMIEISREILLPFSEHGDLISLYSHTSLNWFSSWQESLTIIVRGKVMAQAPVHVLKWKSCLIMRTTVVSFRNVNSKITHTDYIATSAWLCIGKSKQGNKSRPVLNDILLSFGYILFTMKDYASS